MTINVIGRLPKRGLLLVPLMAMACYESLHFLQATTSQNVLTCKFIVNQLHVEFITKDCKRHYKLGQLKVGYVL